MRKYLPTAMFNSTSFEIFSLLRSCEDYRQLQVRITNSTLRTYLSVISMSIRCNIGIKSAPRLTFVPIFSKITVLFFASPFLETTMPIRFTFLFLAILAICCHTSDSRKEQSAPPHTQRATTSPIPGDLRIVFGEGGGFAGRWKGYTITGDGSVVGWAGAMAEENPRSAARLTSNRIQELWNSINEARYFDRVSDETGNMTMFIVITAKGKLHRISWAKTDTTGSELAPVQRLFETCQSIVAEQK
jgi:hypothetical protein